MIKYLVLLLLLPVAANAKECPIDYRGTECKVLPNGDLRIESKFRDKRGRQYINIIKRRVDNAHP